MINDTERKAQDSDASKLGDRMCSCIECIGYESEAGEDIELHATPRVYGGKWGSDLVEVVRI